jgi:hypothetical protein
MLPAMTAAGERPAAVPAAAMTTAGEGQARVPAADRASGPRLDWTPQ